MNRLSFVPLAFLVAACNSNPGAGVARAATELRNADVTWDGTDIGLVPHVSGPPARYLAAHPIEAQPYLLAALEDPERFAAAHVLLSLAKPSHYAFSATQWNGLSVSLNANGTIQFRPEERATLKARWLAK